MSPAPPTATIAARPWWMTALAGACLLTIAVTMAGDFIVPDARGTEVWFGVEVTGPLAIATAPIHWAIFATGAWAFWTRRPWALTAAACYLFYAAFSHVVWSEVSAHGRGWPIGLLQATAISAVGIALLRARRPRPD